MHEIGIANSIIETIAKEMVKHPLAHAERAGVRIGALAAVDSSALRFCFEVLTRETELEQLKLEIEVVPRRQRCGNCEIEFAIADYDFQCPRCGNLAVQTISGDELEFAFLEVEEHEPSTA